MLNPSANLLSSRGERALRHLSRTLAQSEPECVLDAACQCFDRALVNMPFALYVEEGGCYVPRSAEGLASCPVFCSRGSLARAIRSLGGPVMAVHSRRARRFCALLEPEDRQALRRMGAIALVPFLCGHALPGFLCLGGRCSTLDPERLAHIVSPLLEHLQRKAQVTAA